MSDFKTSGAEDEEESEAAVSKVLIKIRLDHPNID